MPGATTFFVGEKRGEIECGGGIKLQVDYSFLDVNSTDILIVPGGDEIQAIENSALLKWIRKMHQETEFTASVCTGSLILGAAGLLMGKKATTHWSQMVLLSNYGAIPSFRRVIKDGKIITSAGVSAGMDMALYIIELLAGKETAEKVQLELEYAPEPGLNSGHPSTARPAVLEAATLGIGKGHDRNR
jgi:transcriptional regulator GlxA family with amidase domain